MNGKTTYRLVFLTDLHTGHPKVPTDKLHNDLTEVFYPYLNDELDYLIIGGDFFDSLLDLNGKAGFYALLIISELRSLALAHDFKIRVIRGTFSHDRHQNQHFLVKKKDETDDLVRVFDSVGLELAEPNLTILYMADDLALDDPIKELKGLMNVRGIEEVDIFVHHGYFEHLIPPKAPLAPFNTLFRKQVEPFVKGIILNGHIHTSSVEGKVLSGGSFERMTHYDEGPKGFWVIDYTPESGKTVTEFIENPKATIFKTLDLSKADPMGAETKFIEWLTRVDELRIDDSRLYLRVITDEDSYRTAFTKLAKDKLGSVIVTFKKTKDARDAMDPEEVVTEISDLPVLTEENICHMTCAFLNEKNISIFEEDAQLVFDVL